MNQRQHTRLTVSNMGVEISDKIGCSTGTIKDISRLGICITNIPRELKTQNDSFTAVISSKGHQFRLQLRPKWVKQDGLTLMTGAIIDTAPWDWTAMLIQMEPKDTNVWLTH